MSSINILNQDKDALVKVTKVKYAPKYWGGMLFGFNVYAVKWFKKTLLGTYDNAEDAAQVTNEIRVLMKHGARRYGMPEASLELSELFELEGRELDG
jgi:hypothetical protein